MVSAASERYYNSLVCSFDVLFVFCRRIATNTTTFTFIICSYDILNDNYLFALYYSCSLIIYQVKFYWIDRFFSLVKTIVSILLTWRRVGEGVKGLFVSYQQNFTTRDRDLYILHNAISQNSNKQETVKTLLTALGKPLVRMCIALCRLSSYVFYWRLLN